MLRAIRGELPHENLVYVADSGHAPYGDRHAGFISDRAARITEFLLAQGAKAIVVACNTATVVAVERLRSWCPVPIVAMEPAIKPASLTTKSGVVGVLATSRTLASPSVARLCKAYGENVEIILQPCPGLVEQVEQVKLVDDATRALLVEYIAPLLAAGVDTIVLGCTHYPFLARLIGEIVGPEVAILDPATAVAKEVARRLADQRIAVPRPPSTRFFSSGHPETARAVISALWGSSVEVHGIEDARASRAAGA